MQEENDISVGGSSNRELDSNKTVGVHSDVQIPSASAVLQQALINLRQTELSNRIDTASFVLCTDTGGQPEYQEFLSLLIAASNKQRTSRTFLNYIVAERARCVEFLHMSSGWFDCTEPSLTTSF